jgi:hypothetical protein
MSGKVIALDEKRNSGPYLSAWAECGHCGHGWAAVSPIGVIRGLECPSCGIPAGHISVEIEPDEGISLYTCQCGSQTYFARPDGIMCRSCGIVHAYDALAG